MTGGQSDYFDDGRPAVMPADGADLGRSDRDDALATLALHRGDTVKACRKAMVALYRERCASRTQVTEVVAAFPALARVRAPSEPWVDGDDAVKWLTGQGYTGDHRLAGAVFGVRRWRAVGQVRSRLRQCHGRLKTCWAWRGGNA